MDPIANFSGLASGIQWKDMIEQIMNLEASRSLTPLSSRISLQQARIDAWNTYGGLVSKLKSASLALKDGSSFGMYKTTAGTNAAGKALISATASSAATPGNYRVEVVDLARADKLSGKIESSTSAELGMSGQFLLNGRPVDIVATDSLASIRDKINAANTGSNASGVTATILSTSSTSHRLILTADQTGSRGIELVDSASSGGVLQQLGILSGTQVANTSLTDSSKTQSQRFSDTSSKLATLLGVSPAPAQTTIVINGQKVAVDLANDSLIDVMNRVVNAGGSASTVQETVGGRTMHRLSVQGAVTADANAMFVGDTATSAEAQAASQRIVELLGFSTGQRANSITAGTDSVATIDGFRITRRTNVISDAIAGVTVNLLAADAAGRTSTSTNPDFAISRDPKTIPAGTYALNFEATSTTSTTATDDSDFLTVASHTGAQDGVYGVSFTTSTTRSNSATGSVAVSSAPSTVATGQYDVIASILRSKSATSASLDVLAAASTVAAGTYGVGFSVNRTSAASVATLRALAAGSGVAAGTYGVQATFSRTASTSSASLAGTAAPASVAAGSYGVDATFARRATATSASLGVTAASSSVAAGSYGVSVTAQREATTTNAAVTAQAAPSTVAPGTLGIQVTSTRTATSTNASLSVTLADSTVAGAAGTSYDIALTTNGSGAITGGTIGGVSATWDAATQTLTRSDGLFQAKYTGTTTKNTTTVVGTVTLQDTVTGGSIGGTAATWDAAAKTLTRADGVQIGYNAAATASTLDTATSTNSSTVSAGDLTITDRITGGTLGGVAATWDGATQTFTRADGLQVKYTGTAQANNLGASSTVSVGTVDVIDEITSATLGGVAATWDAGAKTLTRADGLQVTYSGAMVANNLGASSTSSLGTLTVKDDISSATIGGVAATWDAAAKTLTRADGLQVEYTGAIATNNLNASSTAALGDVTVTDTVTGGTLGGQSATWDATAKTLTDANGLKVAYSGATPTGTLGSTTTSSVGSVTITDSITGGTFNGAAVTWDDATDTWTDAQGLAVSFTGTTTPAGSLGTTTTAAVGSVTISETTAITGGTFTDGSGVAHAATWDEATKTLTASSGSPATGLAVTYSGTPTSGPAGNVTVATTVTYDMNGATIGGEAADWDSATGILRGRAGSRFEGLEMAYSGTGVTGYAGDLVVEGDIGVDLTVSRDTESSVKSVQAFAEAYNEVTGFVRNQQATGGPLATQGTLRGATRSLTEVMLADVASLAGTAFSRAANAGLALNKDGVLTLDSAKLSSVLETSANDVQALFAGVGNSMFQATDSISAAYNGTVSSQIRSLESSNATLDRRIGDVESRLEVRRQSLIRQYTQMEMAISKIQSQGNWLTQQFQSMQPNG